MNSILRHAYLIIAHEQPVMLQQLIDELDDERNDIYVHIDKKAPFDGSDFHTEKSNLTILKKRIDGRWGDYSLVEIEFALLHAATEQIHYEYYHLLSGVDITVKSQTRIHQECEQLRGTEFIGIAQNVTENQIRRRSQHYFPFRKHFKSDNKLIKLSRNAWEIFQNIIGYKRYPNEVKKGSQWWSITDDFARYALSLEREFKHYFKGTYCPDEMVFQTICWNSPYRKNLYSETDEFYGCRRWIKWINGALILLDESLIAEARKSTAWFARKLPPHIATSLKHQYSK